jgi:uncharacterized small protein (DUF1192 family)
MNERLAAIIGTFILQIAALQEEVARLKAELEERSS